MSGSLHKKQTKKAKMERKKERNKGERNVQTNEQTNNEKKILRRKDTWAGEQNEMNKTLCRKI